MMIRAVLVLLSLYFTLCMYLILACKNSSETAQNLPAINTPPVPEFRIAPSITPDPLVSIPPAIDDPYADKWVNFAPFDHGQIPVSLDDPEGEKKTDWSKDFGISAWPQQHHANGGLAYQNVVPQSDGSCKLLVDAKGSAEIQQTKAKMRKGRVGVVANMGQLRKGIISAPIWMYSGYIPRGTKFEVDVEFTGNSGFEITYHDGLRRGKNYYRQDGNFSNEEMKIEYDFDIDAGFFHVIINDKTLYTLTKEEVEADGYRWINKPVFPIYMAWAFDHSWAGGNFDQKAPAYELTLLKRLTTQD